MWVTWWVVVVTVLVSIAYLYMLGPKLGVLRRAGIDASNGWIFTQRQFNVVEVLVLLVHLVGLRRHDITSALTLLTVSMATFERCMSHMSIILLSDDPVKMVPLPQCAELSPIPKTVAHMQVMLAKEGCGLPFVTHVIVRSSHVKLDDHMYNLH
ncbi:hypothetical protein DYB26_001249 [Aphanomyces astaci]|uniref:Uncharacterized protein n=1 Tax=Aphanomyces astaci TaxID=112090 RepID=A0A418ES87_APHAT|nr:hypothetical protein DYB26_001249 [Aphanomyces astaci]